MAMRTITFRHKDNDSRVSSCPALYDAVGPLGEAGYIVQGKTLTAGWRERQGHRAGYVVYGAPLTDPADRARLVNLDVDEDAVWVTASDLAAAAVDPDVADAPEAGRAAVWVPANVLDLTRTPALS